MSGSKERLCILQIRPEALAAAAAPAPAAAEDTARSADAVNISVGIAAERALLQQVAEQQELLQQHAEKEALLEQQVAEQHALLQLQAQNEALLEQQVAKQRVLLQQQAQREALLQQQLQVASQQLHAQRGQMKQLVTEVLDKDELIAELSRTGGSQERQLVAARSAGPRPFEFRFGTAVDREAAATATMAAANSAAGLAAAAVVGSAESPWLYDQAWVQPLQAPSVPVVRLERAQAPGAVAAANTEAAGFETAEAVAAADAQQESEQQLPQQELQPEQQAVQPRAAMVEFRFRCVTQPGEQLWLVGDADALGSWNPAAGAQMTWGEGHIWSVSLPFEQGATVAYKAVLQLGDSEPTHWRWQAGCNCVVEARSDSNDSSDSKTLKVEHVFN
ncbi:hypothetical protein COO60DRAFT_1660310 [Scenedesmus sp. NREL 46B-D3]|nr:hypothetical protein COO60DRAFT_1660310 [Scenedesmus sp. NREL 46B-D3]